MDTNWKYNVSKKIAQLTKVIFRLHTESLDRRDLVAHVKKKCDDEIAAVVRHSNEIIMEVQKGASEYRENLEKVMHDEYNNKYEQVKLDFQAYKQKLDEDAKKISVRSEEKAKELEKQVDTLNLKLKEAETAFLKATTEIQSISDGMAVQMTENHKKELENLVTESNLKYNKLVVESAKKEEDLKLQFQKEMVEIRRNAASDAHAQLDAMKKKNLELENGAKLMERQNKKLQQNINTLNTKIEKLEKEKADLIKQNDAAKAALQEKHKAELGELKAAMEKLRNEQQNQNKELDKLLAEAEEKHKKDLEEQEAEFIERENAFHEKIAQLEESLSKTAGISDQSYKDLIRRHQEEIEALEAKHLEENAKAQQKETEMHNEILAVQKQYLEELEALKQSHAEEKTKMNKEFDDLMKLKIKEYEDMKHNYEERISDLQANLAASSSSTTELIEAANAENSELKEQVRKMQTEHELMIQDMYNQHNNEITKLTLSHEGQVEGIKRNFELKMNELHRSYQEQIDQLQQNHENKTKQLKEKCELNLRLSIEQQKTEFEKTMGTKLEKLREQWDNEFNRMKFELDQKQQLCDELQANLDAGLYQKNSLTNEMKNRISELDKRHQQEIAELKKSKNELELELNQKIIDTRRDKDNEIKNIKRAHDLEIEEYKQKLINADNQRVAELTQQGAQFEEERNILLKKIEDLKQEIENIKANRELSKNELYLKIEELGAKHLSAINDLQEKFKEEKQQKYQQYEDLQIRNKKLIEELQNQLKEAHETNQKLVDEMDILSKANKEDALSKFAELEKQKVNDLQSQAEQYQKQIESMNKKIENLQNKIRAYQMEANEQVEELTQQYQVEISELRNQCEEEKQTLKDQFAVEQQENKEKINEYIILVEEWEAKYNTREARPQDLERIQFLEDTVKEKSDTLTKLFNELKHYQNELVNRESAYNKLFNAAPNVGVLNVIERKIQRDQMYNETRNKNLPPLSKERESPRRQKRPSTPNTRKSSQK